MNRTQLRPAIAAALFATLTAVAASAGATTLQGTIDTSAANSPTNQSFDGVTYYNAPAMGSLPSAAFTVGAFDFSTAGVAVSGATVSGNFGSNDLGSGTAEVDLFLNAVEVASCDAGCALASQSNDVAWSYTFSGAQLSALAGGDAVLTAVQQGSSQVVLDPTQLSVDVTPVPEPTTAWLMSGALPLLALALRRRA